MKNIFIWGVSVKGRAVLSLLETHTKEHRVIGFIDSDPNLIGTAVSGRIVHPPEQVALLDDDILILIASQHFPEIWPQLLVHYNHINFCEAGKYVMLHKYSNQFPMCMEHIWNSKRTYTGAEGGCEDLIIEAIFNAVGIEAPKYFDIGANIPITASIPLASFPFRGNNTYLFYQKGASGTAADPLALFIEEWNRLRPRDKFLNIALSDTCAENVPIHSLIHRFGELSTLDSQYANRLFELYGIRAGTVYVRQDVFNNVADKDVQLIDIDTDCVDMEILKSINFEMFPDLLVICIEQRHKECIDYMKYCGFTLFCSNHLNSIFIRDSIVEKVFSDKLCHEIFSWHMIWRLIQDKSTNYLPIW